MHSKLARILLTRGVIRQGTVIQSYHNVRGLSCARNTSVLDRFVIRAAIWQNGSQMVFETHGPDDAPCRIRSEDVLMLDGMLIARIALAQNLTLDGEELNHRKRRGRRKSSLLRGSV